jgi:VanZ family protein
VAVHAPPQSWRRLAVVAFVLALTGGAVVALWPADGPPPPFPHVDKLAHALGFAVLWALGRAAGVRAGPLALGLLAYGAAIEGLQALTPTREASAADWLADGAGLLLGHALLARVAPRRL